MLWGSWKKSTKQKILIDTPLPLCPKMPEFKNFHPDFSHSFIYCWLSRMIVRWHYRRLSRTRSPAWKFRDSSAQGTRKFSLSQVLKAFYQYNGICLVGLLSNWTIYFFGVRLTGKLKNLGRLTVLVLLKKLLLDTNHSKMFVREIFSKTMFRFNGGNIAYII